jgi:hypothetical protein
MRGIRVFGTGVEGEVQAGFVLWHVFFLCSLLMVVRGEKGVGRYGLRVCMYPTCDMYMVTGIGSWRELYGKRRIEENEMWHVI